MSMKNLKMKAVLLAAALVYPALAWSAAADLAAERTALFTGNSFSVLVPSDGSLKAAYGDLLAIVRPYENTRMSPKELGALASGTENAMHAMGYTGAVIRIERAEGGRPLAMSFSWDPERMKPVKVDRAAIIKQLQSAMNSQWEEESEKEQNELPDAVQSSAQTLQSLSEAEDQKEWMLSTAQSYVEGAANSALNSGIASLVEGANAQISMGYDREERGMTLSGKLLIPIVSDPSYTLFTQTGLTEGDNDRTLFHLGLGQRFYPEAIDFENAGTYMFGMNAVYDYDLDRYHQRISLGGEFGYESLFLWGNVYQRLSGWRTSPDFDSGLVEERPANGWDVGARYALPVYLPLALTGSYAQWYGDRVSPWGDTDPDELMKDPHIWSVGLEWTPVPALGFSLKQEIEERGDTNTEIMASFNIPLSNGIEDAFNSETGGVQNTVAGTRNAFIERDYTMPLEYRSKPGKFIITQCGLDAENNDYCFHIQNGFEEPVAGQGVTVTPSDKCVLMTNGGSYTTDGNGNIHASVESSCVIHTVVDVEAGSSSEQFPIDISGALLAYTLTPEIMTLTSEESGIFTLDGGEGAVGVPVTWRIDEGPGSLEEAQEQTGDRGTATVKYVADADAVFNYEATVVANVAGKDFPAFVNVTVTGLTMTVPPETDGTEYTVVIDGGTPGGEFTAETEGPGNIVVPDTGLKFDENGHAEIVIEVIPPGEGTVNIKVTDTESGKEGTGSTQLALEQHDAVNIEYPSYQPLHESVREKTVGFNEDFSVPVHGLLPGSVIRVYPYAADGFTVTPVSEDITADENGDAVIEFNRITSVIDSFKVEFGYFRNTAEQESGTYVQKFSSDPIALFAYQPELSGPAALNGDDHDYTVLVSRGTPGGGVQCKVTGGHGELAYSDSEFDANGNADARVNIIAPGTDAVTVTCEDLSSGLKGSLTTALNLNAYGAALVPPVYEKGGIREENTVDVEESFELTVEGLKPGTMATVTGSGVIPAKGQRAQYPVNQEGQITIAYDPIPGGSVTEFGISVEYVVNASGITDTYEAKVNVHNYFIGIKAPAAADNGQPYDIEISGGRPDGTFTATVDHGEIYCQRSRSMNGIMLMDSRQYSFNNMGVSYCTITPEAGWNGQITVTVDAAGDSESAVTDTNLMTYRPVIEYTSSSSIDGVQGRYDYNEPFEVMITGLLDGSDVTVEGLPSGVSVKNSTLTANGGAVTVEFNPVTTVSSFTFNVKYFKDKADQATGTQTTLSSGSLSLKPYSIKFSTRSQTDLDGTMPSNIYLEGGKEGEEITWSVTGDGSITPSTGYFGADGTAAATVTGTGTLSTAVVVTAKSMGQTVQLSMNFVNYGLRFISLPSFTNVNAQTYRNTVDTNEEFEVEVNKARPGSEIVWSSDLATPQQATTVASADGTSRMTFNAIKNLDDTAVKVFAEYERNASVKARATANLRLHQYDMALDVGDGKIDAYSNPGEKILDRPVLTVSGGKPGHQAVMSLTGSATFEDGTRSNTFTFNEKGEADLTLVSEADFATDVGVQVTPADDSFTNSTCSGTLVYSFDSWPYTPEIDQTSIKDPSISAARTIDVETQYTFAVTNVYPNTEVTWSTSNGSAALAQVTTVADKNGRATVTLNPVTDYTLKNFRLTAQVWKNPREQTTLNADVNVKQYNLSISSNKSSIVADESFTVTVSGGRPGSAVSWSRTGDGTITSRTSVFDSNGRATANVRGSAPYNSTIHVTAYGMSKSASTAVTVTILTQITLTSDGCIPYFDRVKDITIKLSPPSDFRCQSTHQAGIQITGVSWYDFVNSITGCVQFKSKLATILCSPSTGAVSGPSVYREYVILNSITVYYN